MKILRLGVKSKLQLLACTTTTATLDPSHVCDLHHSSQPHWILNPPSGAGEQTHILMDTSWVLNLLSYNGVHSLLYSMPVKNQNTRNSRSPILFNPITISVIQSLLLSLIKSSIPQALHAMFFLNVQSTQKDRN